MMRSKDAGTVAILPQHAGSADRADVPSGGAQLFTFPSPTVARVSREGCGLGERLTAFDHAALAAWIGDPGHGYDRLHIERDVRGGMAGASFALVYRPRVPWSVWGVARQDGALEVWRCATGKTIGRYRTITAALAALPPASSARRA